MDDEPRIKHVPYLPDLMKGEDYVSIERRRVRLRIRITDEGIEVLGDSAYPGILEDLLRDLDPAEIEMVLCG